MLQHGAVQKLELNATRWELLKISRSHFTSDKIVAMRQAIF
jgi:hypothetical protein